MNIEGLICCTCGYSSCINDPLKRVRLVRHNNQLFWMADWNFTDEEFDLFQKKEELPYLGEADLSSCGQIPYEKLPLGETK